MKGELPEFKRCCLCLPLRHGLLAFAYFKLIISVLFALYIIYYLTNYIMVVVITGYSFLIPEILFQFVCMLVVLLDISLTVVFLIGGHKKNVKLLRVFYIYSIVVLCINTLVLVASTVFKFIVIGHSTDTKSYHSIIASGFYVHSHIIVGITVTAIQAYVILLLRSEIRKLRNSHNFRFVNMANETKCEMVVNTADQENITNNRIDQRIDTDHNEATDIDATNCKTEHKSFKYNTLQNTTSN